MASNRRYIEPRLKSSGVAFIARPDRKTGRRVMIPAEILGMKRMTLRGRMFQLGIQRDAERMSFCHCFGLCWRSEPFPGIFFFPKKLRFILTSHVSRHLAQRRHEISLFSVVIGSKKRRPSR